ncbi:uncharacterized protein LOC141803231 [Halichoeres trimaculatus]|uniref:uncharacterized protein LOC141803231 n=1 Tax=Halichoeres trimaculatus TaxID=147232 RepID=UPI003D9EBF40
MFMNDVLKAEALSSLFGQTLTLSDKIHGNQGDTLSLEDIFYSIIVKIRQAQMKGFFVNAGELFDPQYDYDFTNLSDFSQCMRGNEPYERPKGWYRIALKVKGKYPDGDTWLGTDGWRSHSVSGEWPVSYHGTSLDGAHGIIKGHYKAGARAMYGRGIYSTPNIRVAEDEGYAKTFTSPSTGKCYKVILQNRINPQVRWICPISGHWLIPVNEGTSAEQERNIAEISIRPYGILIKEV